MRNPISTSGAQDGAMTEVALALAMGFFSIMVLTLVSMGGGRGEAPTYQAIRLVQTAPDGAAAEAPARDDVIVIFDGGRFLDTDLKPLDPAALAADGAHRIVLAVDPSARLADVTAARARIGGANVVVANLDAGWRAAIAKAREAAGD